MTYWETIADDLKRAAGRFIVHADEKLTAFLELEAAIRKNGIAVAILQACATTTTLKDIANKAGWLDSLVTVGTYDYEPSGYR